MRLTADFCKLLSGLRRLCCGRGPALADKALAQIVHPAFQLAADVGLLQTERANPGCATWKHIRVVIGSRSGPTSSALIDCPLKIKQRAGKAPDSPEAARA